MKVLFCLAVVVAYASAMIAPQINGFSDFSDPVKFDNGFNGGIGEGKTFDVNDMHNFPDFSHGFENFDDSKGTPNQHVFTAPNTNLNNKAERNFEDQHLNNFLSKDGNAGIPADLASHYNGLITDSPVVRGRAAPRAGNVAIDHENGFVVDTVPVTASPGVGNVADDQQNVFLNRPATGADHQDSFINGTAPGSGSAASQVNVAVPINKQNGHNHISQDITNNIHNGVIFKPVTIQPLSDDHFVRPASIRKFPHKEIKFDHPDHKLGTVKPIPHEPVEFDPIPTPAPIVHEFITHAPNDKDFPTHAPIVHKFVTPAPIDHKFQKHDHDLRFDHHVPQKNQPQRSGVQGQTVYITNRPDQTTGSTRLTGNTGVTGSTGATDTIGSKGTTSLTGSTDTTRLTGSTDTTRLTGGSGGTTQAVYRSAINNGGNANYRGPENTKQQLGNVQQTQRVFQPSNLPAVEQHQRNGVYQQSNQFAPEQEFHGNSFVNTHDDHDSNIKLPSVEDLHKHIPTPAVFKPTIAPFVHPDGPVGGPVTVSDIQFDHPNPPKKFTHDEFPSFNGRQSKFSRANDIPGFFSDPFGSVGGSSAHKQGLNSHSCPTPINPAAQYVLSSTATDYPREAINAELARRPEIGSMIANKGQQKPSLNVVDGTDSCVSSQNSLTQFRKYNGACYVLEGEDVDMIECQSANCNQCNTSGAQSNIQGLCVPQYQNINLMAYCVNAPDVNNKISRQQVPVPMFCGCRMVQC